MSESSSGELKWFKRQLRLSSAPLHIRPRARQITFNDRLHEMGKERGYKRKGADNEGEGAVKEKCQQMKQIHIGVRK